MRHRKQNPKAQALLAERAYGMRHAPTPSEAALFRLLSGKKLGVAFKRQVPLGGRYIGDFVAAAEKLVVEVDGAVHAQRRQADARRDRVLRRLGYRVLRLKLGLYSSSRWWPSRAFARLSGRPEIERGGLRGRHMLLIIVYQ